MSSPKHVVERLLKLRPHSESEIRTKLKKKKFSDFVIDETVEYYKKLELIDDEQFAKAWTQARLSKPFGLNRIKTELIAKGIDLEIIKAQLAKVADKEAELETVIKLIQRRRRIYKKLEPAKQKQRLYGYLIRRGFNPETIMKAINRL